MKKNSLFFAVLLLVVAIAFSTCKKGPAGEDTPAMASISALLCADVRLSGPAIIHQPFSSTVLLPYTGGNGAAYGAGSSVASTGVTGLTATVSAGTLTNNTGNLSINISGTADTTGVAGFTITFGGQSCTFTLPVYTTYGPPPVVGYLGCVGASMGNPVYHNIPFTGQMLINVASNNTASYGPGTPIPSTGVTGLTATLRAGSISGLFQQITYDISGTATAAGTASFPISFGGQSCTVTVPVLIPETYCTGAPGPAKIICLCNEYYNMLTAAEKSQTLLPLTLANAKRWGFETVVSLPRNGVEFRALSANKVDKALAILKEALGQINFPREGYQEFDGIRLIDEYLFAQTGSSAYGSGRYSIAFLGIPATTGRWILQISGHHFGQNLTFNNGQLVAISPSLRGVEPGSLSVPPTVHQPLIDELGGMREVLASLTASQLAAAKIPDVFSEVLMAPGAGPGAYPAVKQGIPVGSLGALTKAYLKNVLVTYFADAEYNAVTYFNNHYLTELDNMYICYSGSPAGVPDSAHKFLRDPGDYIRIDGPTLWIELLYVNGHAIPIKHVHTVFRDRSLDYLGL